MAPRLVAAMPVRNEADRYLRRVLAELARYCDAIVVLDDASTDDTPLVCGACERVILHRRPVSTFLVDESALRSELWRLAVAEEPDWILAIDADEVLEERFLRERDALLDQETYDVIAFVRHDFWTPTNYRVDGVFAPSHKKMLARHRPGFPYRWDGRRTQSERLPANLPGTVLWSDLRVKHFGYATPEDRLRKYLRAVATLPEWDHGAILCDNPVLAEWVEQPGRAPGR